MAEERFAARCTGGPAAGVRTLPGPWPLPDEIFVGEIDGPNLPGRYVKVRESQLEENPAPGVLVRGAEYEWRPGSVGPCVCGHPFDDHYVYSLNGHPQGRCRTCDPHTRSDKPGNYVMDSGSYEAAMYHAADHDYDPVAPTSVGGDDA